jgi:hypothetical protein
MSETKLQIKYENGHLSAVRIGQRRLPVAIKIKTGLYVSMCPDTRQPVGIEVVDCASTLDSMPKVPGDAYVSKLIAIYRDQAVKKFRRRLS